MGNNVALHVKAVLILEDNDERIAAFEAAVVALGPEYELRLRSGRLRRR
jgi:hypothetical protein